MSFFKLFFGLSILVSTGSLAHAQNVHGTLRVVKGDVQILSAKTKQKVKARLGEKVYPKDVIITGKDARVKIVMVDNNELNVSPNSQIEIQNYEFDPNAGKKEVLLNVIYGKVRSKVEQQYDGKTSHFQIKTKGAVAGVRGTDFITSFDRGSGNSQVITFQGKVEFGVAGPDGSIKNPVMVMPGNMASAKTGSAAPSAPAPVPKEELKKMDSESKAETGGVKTEVAPDSGKGSSEKKDEEAKKDEGQGNKGGVKADAEKKESENKDAAKAESEKQGGNKQEGDSKQESADKGSSPKADSKTDADKKETAKQENTPKPDSGAKPDSEKKEVANNPSSANSGREEGGKTQSSPGNAAANGSAETKKDNGPSQGTSASNNEQAKRPAPTQGSSQPGPAKESNAPNSNLPANSNASRMPASTSPGVPATGGCTMCMKEELGGNGPGGGTSRVPVFTPPPVVLAPNQPTQNTTNSTVQQVINETLQGPSTLRVIIRTPNQ